MSQTVINQKPTVLDNNTGWGGLLRHMRRNSQNTYA